MGESVAIESKVQGDVVVSTEDNVFVPRIVGDGDDNKTETWNLHS